MALKPVFVGTDKVGMAQVTTANANRDGTGALVDVFVPGANGGQVDKIEIEAVGVTTAGMIRLYISDGTNHRLWKEVDVTAVAAPGATVKTFTAIVEPSGGMKLQTGYKLRASTEKTETFNIIATGGDY